MGQRYRKRLLMGFLLQLMDQTTGILVVSNYMVLLRLDPFWKAQC